MTGQELMEVLSALSKGHDLTELKLVIRLVDSDDETSMGEVAMVSVECGCTDTPALVFDCDQDPKNSPPEDE